MALLTATQEPDGDGRKLAAGVGMQFLVLQGIEDTNLQLANMAHQQALESEIEMADREMRRLRKERRRNRYRETRQPFRSYDLAQR